MPKKILHIPLNGEFFDDIKADKKPFEFRLDNPFWRKRLINKEYDEVWFKRGYPKKTDADKIIKRKYLGYEKKHIKHKHFGDDLVLVFAIHTTGVLDVN